VKLPLQASQVITKAQTGTQNCNNKKERKNDGEKLK
jgi:hypothetical protein